jgi:perosamine synthetase
VPDFTFPATANVVVKGGSTPALVDVNMDTYAIKLEDVKKAVGVRTSAIIPVHPFGHPFEVDELYEVAESRGLDVIEDAATAMGTKYKGKSIGSSGRAVCFSFHPRKLLTTGEGGCLLTDDEKVFERAEAMRTHGQVTNKGGKIKFRYNGLNYRMSDVQAAIGVAQLRKIDAIIRSRRRQAKLYDELLSSTKVDAKPPVEETWAYHTYQSYVVVLGKSFASNAEVTLIMKERFGIETQIGTYALREQPAFKETCRAVGGLKTSKALYERSLTLPLFEALTDEQQTYVVESLSRASRF